MADRSFTYLEYKGAGTKAFACLLGHSKQGMVDECLAVGRHGQEVAPVLGLQRHAVRRVELVRSPQQLLRRGPGLAVHVRSTPGRQCTSQSRRQLWQRPPVGPCGTAGRALRRGPTYWPL